MYGIVTVSMKLIKDDHRGYTYCAILEYLLAIHYLDTRYITSFTSVLLSVRWISAMKKRIHGRYEKDNAHMYNLWLCDAPREEAKLLHVFVIQFIEWNAALKLAVPSPKNKKALSPLPAYSIIFNTTSWTKAYFWPLCGLWTFNTYHTSS